MLDKHHEFDMLPQFWETAWFRALCLAWTWPGAWRGTA